MDKSRVDEWNFTVVLERMTVEETFLSRWGWAEDRRLEEASKSLPVSLLVQEEM
jgi:hypothetical protein